MRRGERPGAADGLLVVIDRFPEKEPSDHETLIEIPEDVLKFNARRYAEEEH